MPEKEEKRLNTVRRFLDLNISKEKELQQIVELAARICESPIAMITFIDKVQHVKFSVGTNIKEISFEDSFCKFTILQSEIFIIQDALSDRRVQHNSLVTDHPGFRFYAGCPLTTHDNQNMGTLCVFNVEPAKLGEIQKKMLHRLSKQVIQLIEFDASLQLLKEQYETSLQEENKLRSFFESSSSVHLLLDRELRVISFNKALLDILGNNYTLSIAEGMGCDEYVEPSFLEEFRSNCNKALQKEIVKTESTIASPQGDISWYITYEPAFDSEQNIVGISYTATDITQTMLHGKTVTEQENAFRQIDRIMSGELHMPLKKVTSAMNRLKQQGYPKHIEEFIFLDNTFNELREKFNEMFLTPVAMPATLHIF